MGEGEGWAEYRPDPGVVAWNAAEAGEYDKAQAYGLFYLARQVRDLRQGLEDLTMTVQEVGQPRVHHGVVLVQQTHRGDVPQWRARWERGNEMQSHEGPDKEEVLAWAASRPAELRMALTREGEWLPWYPDDADEPDPTDDM